MPQENEKPTNEVRDQSRRQLTAERINDPNSKSPFSAHPAAAAHLTRRLSILTYGVVSYLLFFASFCYAIGWVGNLWVPKSIDSEPTTPFGQALLVNTLLLLIFAVQHSVMARPIFKEWWTRFISPSAERSTYVALSSVLLMFLFWQWQPMGQVIWTVENPTGRALLYSVFGFGWMLVLAASFMINHFDLFGLRQVWLFARGRQYVSLKFTVPALYNWVRHPLYIGWLLAFWATPTMTAAHLLFAVATTVHILVAIRFEEQDLVAAYGKTYSEYRRKVPMLIPRAPKAIGREVSALAADQE